MSEEKKDAMVKLNEFAEAQKELLRFDKSNIQEAFQEQAMKFYDAAIRYAKAEFNLGQKKIALEKVIAAKDQQIRNSQEKTTETFIDKEIKRDADYQKAKDLIIWAEYQTMLNHQLMRAWEQRKDMLIQVGSTLRAEFNANVQINKPAGYDDSIQPKSEESAKFNAGLA
jgi:hypothetical protein